MSFSRRRKFAALWTPDSEGVKHPSKGEAHWFDRLLQRQRAGQICALERRPTYVIRIAPGCAHCAEHGVEVCKVELDARYIEDGVLVIDDYKGVEGNTEISKLKRALVRLVCGVDVRLAGPALAHENRKAELKAFKAAAGKSERARKKAGPTCSL